MYTDDELDSVEAAMAEYAEEVCRELYPDGKKIGDSWRTGGNGKHSYDINLKKGIYGDWGDGERGMKAGWINCWRDARQLEFLPAMKEILEFLEPFGFKSPPRPKRRNRKANNVNGENGSNGKDSETEERHPEYTD